MPLIEWLGLFHPPMVHFPIALIVAAAVAEFLLIFTGRTLFDSACRYCLWFGVIGGCVAAMLGWFAGDFKWTDSDQLMTTHRWLGTATTVWALISLALREKDSAALQPLLRIFFRIALFAGAMLVIATGMFGAVYVRGIDYYAW